MVKPRHELKYYINNFDYISLRNKLKRFMKVDSHALSNGKYEVINLYFDDKYNSAYQEKLQGVDKRKKFRIRTYNYDDSFIRLEKKAKVDGLSIKTASRITKEQLSDLMEGNPDFLLNPDYKEFIDLYTGIMRRFIEPKVLIRYTREAYIQRAGNIRITFDSQLRAGDRNIDLLNPEASFKYPESNLVVLEVKYDEFFPDTLKSVIQSSAKLRTSISKYILGRKYNYYN